MAGCAYVCMYVYVCVCVYLYCEFKALSFIDLLGEGAEEDGGDLKLQGD